MVIQNNQITPGERIIANDCYYKESNGTVYPIMVTEHARELTKLINTNRNKPVDPSKGSYTITYRDGRTEVIPENGALVDLAKKITAVAPKIIEEQKKAQEEFVKAIQPQKEPSALCEQLSDVKYCTDTVVPHSDRVATYRNVYNLTMSLIQLTAVILVIAGVSSPVGFAIAGALLLLLGILSLSLLKYYNQIDAGTYKKLLFLTFTTAATLFVFAGCLAGNADYEDLHKGILITLSIFYSVWVAYQGALFLYPQGYTAWYKNSINKIQEAKDINDVKDKNYYTLVKYTSYLSMIEGSLWIIRGLVELGLNIARIFVGDVSVVAQIDYWLIFSLFFVLFNVGYTLSLIITSAVLKNSKILNWEIKGVKPIKWILENILRLDTNLPDPLKLQNQLKELIGETDDEKILDKIKNLDQKQCLQTLNFFKRKLLGFNKTTHKEEEYTIERFEKKLMRLQEMTDSTVIEYMNVTYLDRLITEMSNPATSKDALDISQKLIKDFYLANARKVKYFNDYWKVACIGFTVGLALSIVCDIAEGSQLPGLKEIHLPEGNAGEAIAGSISIVECAFWALMNHEGFLKRLDDPAGRDLDNKNDLLAIKKHFNLQSTSFSLENLDNKIKEEDDKEKAKKDLEEKTKKVSFFSSEYFKCLYNKLAS